MRRCRRIGRPQQRHRRTRDIGRHERRGWRQRHGFRQRLEGIRPPLVLGRRPLRRLRWRRLLGLSRRWRRRGRAAVDERAEHPAIPAIAQAACLVGHRRRQDRRRDRTQHLVPAGPRTTLRCCRRLAVAGRGVPLQLAHEVVQAAIVVLVRVLPELVGLIVERLRHGRGWRGCRSSAGGRGRAGRGFLLGRLAAQARLVAQLLIAVAGMLAIGDQAVDHGAALLDRVAQARPLRHVPQIGIGERRLGRSTRPGGRRSVGSGLARWCRRQHAVKELATIKRYEEQGRRQGDAAGTPCLRPTVALDWQRPSGLVGESGGSA